MDVLESTGTIDVDAFLDAVSWPGNYFHLRTNTLKVDREGLLGKLRDSRPEIPLEPHPEVAEAIRLAVKRAPGPPGSIPPPRGSVEVDKFAGESMMGGAPLYAPGLKQAPGTFLAGDVVRIEHVAKLSWEPGRRVFECAMGTAAVPAKEMHLRRRGVIVQPLWSPYSAPSVQSWPEFEQGLFIDQNLPSMLVARAVTANEPMHDTQCTGEEVAIDACCGAGGKTTHLAQLFNDHVPILAVDRSKKKIAGLQDRCARMGIASVAGVAERAKRFSKNEAVIRFLKGRRTRWLLVDPPCSAIGLRPKLYIDHSDAELRHFPANQLRIIDHALELCSQETRLVYSTCTVTREENEGVVERVVEKHGAKIVDPGIPNALRTPAIPSETLSKAETSKMARFLPTEGGMIGFFICALELP